MILVDTSIWVDHLHSGDRGLAEVLDGGQVLMHPMVLGELACGTLRNRATVLDLLSNLPLVSKATDAEALALIERRALMGRGLGYIDVHLLASVAVAGTARLWTRDKRLAAAAVDLALAFVESR